MFNGDRLALARKRKGLTKTALATQAGITTRALNAFENNEYAPSGETEQKLAEVLGFPPAFFTRHTLDELSEKGVSFRSLKRMTAAQRNTALAAGSFAIEISRWLNQRFDLPTPDVPNLAGEAPADAAQILRQEWGLGQLSISNVIHLVESKGVRVFSLFENCEEVDAFSLWHSGQPYIFSNRIKTSAHRRFDIAHELGHLVLHRHGAPTGPLAEREADQFAASFLMPPDTVKAAVPYFVDVDVLIRLKAKWMVSVSALARRLKDTGMISEWTYRSLCIEISQKGFRKSEPNDYPHETSRIWEKVSSLLRSEGKGVIEIADQLDLPSDEVEKLLWGLTTLGLTSTTGPRVPTNPKGNLRLVEN